MHFLFKIERRLQLIKTRCSAPSLRRTNVRDNNDLRLFLTKFWQNQATQQQQTEHMELKPEQSLHPRSLGAYLQKSLQEAERLKNNYSAY